MCPFVVTPISVLDSSERGQNWGIICLSRTFVSDCTFFPGRDIISGRGFLIVSLSLALVAPWPLMISYLITSSFLVVSLPLIAALKFSLLTDFVLSSLAALVYLSLQFWHPIVRTTIFTGSLGRDLLIPLSYFLSSECIFC
jgi:hypothetical protein